MTTSGFPSAVVALLLACTHAVAAEPQSMAASGKTLFADHDPKAEAEENVSGATCFGDGRCILVADEMVAMQLIRLDLDQSPPSYKTGRSYGLLFEDQCTDLGEREQCDEVDLEAIGLQDSKIYITGSMGNRSRTGKRAKDRWFLARFDITKTGKPRTGSLVAQSSRPILKLLFSRHEVLAPYLELPLQCGGMNVEGLAVIGDQMYFGLRSPAVLETGTAYVVQAPETVLTAKSKSDVPDTIMHRLTFRHGNGKPIKGVGIRALEPFGNRMLIATGDAGVSAPSGKSRRRDIEERCADVPDGPSLPFVEGKEPLQPRIWIWDPGSSENPIEIARLDGPYADEKLEGIAVLANPSADDQTVDLLLTIDGQNDVDALALLAGIKIPN